MDVDRYGEFVAECFWPGVTQEAVVALDQRAMATVADLAGVRDGVRYLGSLLILPDEVVLCRFKGSEASVRRAAVGAGIPFERILESASSPWPPGAEI